MSVKRKLAKKVPVVSQVNFLENQLKEVRVYNNKLLADLNHSRAVIQTLTKELQAFSHTFFGLWVKK